jgi:hypothetical protein
VAYFHVHAKKEKVYYFCHIHDPREKVRDEEFSLLETFLSMCFHHVFFIQVSLAIPCAVVATSSIPFFFPGVICN